MEWSIACFFFSLSIQLLSVSFASLFDTVGSLNKANGVSSVKLHFLFSSADENENVTFCHWRCEVGATRLLLFIFHYCTKCKRVPVLVPVPVPYQFIIQIQPFNPSRFRGRDSIICRDLYALYSVHCCYCCCVPVQGLLLFLLLIVSLFK